MSLGASLVPALGKNVKKIAGTITWGIIFSQSVNNNTASLQRVYSPFQLLFIKHKLPYILHSGLTKNSHHRH
jgi:hypothetical protein